MNYRFIGNIIPSIAFCLSNKDTIDNYLNIIILSKKNLKFFYLPNGCINS